MKKKIVLTGLTPKQFEEALRGEKAFCYLCKREHGDSTAYVSDGQVNEEEIQLSHFKKDVNEETEILVPICSECTFLLIAIAETVQSQNQFHPAFMGQSLN